MARVKIAEFGTVQKLLAGATVAIYEADENGESTGTLATIYQAASGTGTRANPQTLDSNGKLSDDCYVNAAVVAAISNITERTERAVRKIRVNPLEYPLPVTSATFNAQSVTAEDVAAVLPLGWEGAWVTSTAYEYGNIVSNGGSSYICILDHTSGASTEPGVGGIWQTNWSLFASKGASGSGSGDMLAANNLSDVASAASAFANIKQSATDSATGVVELATNAETQTGSDAQRAVTPAGLASLTSTTSRRGLVELATVAESQAGTDTDRAVTPQGLAAAIAGTVSGLVPIKTFIESGVSAFEVIDGENGVVFDDTYTAYEMDLIFVPTADGVACVLQTTSDAGSTFDSGASDYAYVTRYQNATSGTAGNVTVNTQGDITATEIPQFLAAGTSTGEILHLFIKFMNPASDSKYKTVVIEAFGYGSSPGVISEKTVGVRKTISVVNGFRITATAGNFSVNATLYGRKTV